MSSPIGSKRTVKIFVLYLLENINYPLEHTTINDIVMQTDYVMYLDFAESFNEMLDAGLIEELPNPETPEFPLYMITPHGRIVAQELKSDVLASILDKSLEQALRYLDFKRRGVRAECDIETVDANTGECAVRCRLLEQEEVLFESTLRVDSRNRAERMRDNFLFRPDVIYRGYIALMAGKVNFLFND